MLLQVGSGVEQVLSENSQSAYSSVWSAFTVSRYMFIIINQSLVFSRMLWLAISCKCKCLLTKVSKVICQKVAPPSCHQLGR